jgi:histidine phosphotransferase ChpT
LHRKPGTMNQVLLDPYVLELVASRICHDVISPVGAINNGLELLQEMGMDGGAEAISLIAKSAEQANRRLKLFRYAYGAAGGKDLVDAKDLRRVAFDYLQGSRTVLEWPETEPMPKPGSQFPRGVMKAILNLIVLGSEMITKAGLVKLRQPKAGELPIEIHVSGEGSGFRDGMEASLQGTIESKDLDARLVHAYVTGALLRHAGLKLQIQKSPDGRVTFLLGA